MMMNTFHHPYYSASKTEQILSRYRPIAPKPPTLDGPTTPENTPQSPFLKHLQARPSRNRKRGKYGCSPAKRNKNNLLSSPYGIAPLTKNIQLGLSLHSFANGFPPQFQGPGLTSSLEKPVNLVTLPFLPYPSSASVSECAHMNSYSHLDEVMDMTHKPPDVPQEKDLLQNLQAGVAESGSATVVITPRAVRPVGSSISVGCIQEKNTSDPSTFVPKKPDEVEAEIEAETLPTLVTDSKNRVRLANSAYKEMVGQPVCMWLDSMGTYDELLRGNACKRIGGKVMLDLPDMSLPFPSNGFTCKVKIEWASNERKSSVYVSSDVVKLCCDSKDYLFKWRFYTSGATLESNFKI